MKKNMLEGKKIRIFLNQRNFYFTVKKVIEITDTHVIFLDKFDREKGIRIADIIEVSDIRNGGCR